ALCKPTHPVAQRARRETAGGDDDTGAGRRIAELGIADRREREVAESAGAVPALVAGLGAEALGPRGGGAVRRRLAHADPGHPVARLSTTLRIEEMVGEGHGVGIRETELPQTPHGRVHDLDPPTPEANYPAIFCSDAGSTPTRSTLCTSCPARVEQGK